MSDPASTNINGMIIDSGDGRKFTLKEIDPGDMLDLIEAAGSSAGNIGWLRYAQMICTVTAIDGVPVMMPSTKVAVKALARKIGTSGVNALANAIEGKAAANAEEDIETSKN